MTDTALEFVAILLLVCTNGVLSGSEIAIVSVRKVRLEQLARQGDRAARQALRLANAPEDFLSTVQVGITLIGILSGAVGGATIAERLTDAFAQVPSLRPYAASLALAIVVAVITFLSLVLGELLPKRLALSNPEAVARAIAGPMRILSRLTAPLARLLSAVTDWLIDAVGAADMHPPPITEEEIRVLIEQGAQAGTFEETERDMVERVFRLGDRPIRALMTPRTEIEWLDLDAPLSKNLEIVQNSPYSRFPVARSRLDRCKGIVRVRGLLSAYMAGEPVDLEAMAQPPLYVAENVSALRVLEQFKETGTHIALVADEYGGIEGLVTLNDLIEAIFGDLPSAENAEEPAIVQRDDGSWLLDGLLSIDELKNLIERDTLPGEETGYHTLAGFIIAFLGRLPEIGDRFAWDDLVFEVVDMDGTRVDRVLVVPPPDWHDVRSPDPSSTQPSAPTPEEDA